MPPCYQRPTDDALIVAGKLQSRNHVLIRHPPAAAVDGKVIAAILEKNANGFRFRFTHLCGFFFGRFESGTDKDSNFCAGNLRASAALITPVTFSARNRDPSAVKCTSALR